MMNYNNGFVPSYMNPQQQMSNLINQYPQFFNPALQQAVANPNTNTNIQAQNSTPTSTSQNNTITTQPPIMQPQNNINARNDARILYVGNKEEATATPIDLVYNTPTFFFNRGANQVYMKQYDSTTGNAIFKTFVELEPTDEPTNESKSILDINAYQEEFNTIKGQINDLQKTFDSYVESQYQSQNNKDKDKGNSKTNEKRS